MSASPRSVGFIGLGQMGFGMAANLLKAGHDGLAYDVAAELYQLIDTKLGGLHGSNEVLRYYLEA